MLLIRSDLLSFSIDSKKLTEDDEHEIFDEMINTVRTNKSLNEEALMHVIDVYKSFKEMLKDNKKAGVKIEFSRPFAKLVADVVIYGSSELYFKDAKELARVCRSIDTSIEVYPGTDKVLHMDFAFYGFGG